MPSLPGVEGFASHRAHYIRLTDLGVCRSHSFFCDFTIPMPPPTLFPPMEEMEILGWVNIICEVDAYSLPHVDSKPGLTHLINAFRTLTMSLPVRKSQRVNIGQERYKSFSDLSYSASWMSEMLLKDELNPPRGISLLWNKFLRILSFLPLLCVIVWPIVLVWVWLQKDPFLVVDPRRGNYSKFSINWLNRNGSPSHSRWSLTDSFLMKN